MGSLTNKEMSKYILLLYDCQPAGNEVLAGIIVCVD